MRVLLGLLLLVFLAFGGEGAKVVQTPYKAPFKAVVEFYFDEPEKIRRALAWVSNIIYVLSNDPYHFHPGEDIDVVVVIHGAEMTALAKKNKEKYKDVWERVESLSNYGVKFKVCKMAAEQIYGLSAKDFPEFVEFVPSAITEILHWQQQGYALLIPQVFEPKRQRTRVR